MQVLGKVRVKRSQVAVEVRKSWSIAAAALLVLGALLGWAYIDGGERPMTQQSVPAQLPQAGQ